MKIFKFFIILIIYLFVSLNIFSNEKYDKNINFISFSFPFKIKSINNLKFDLQKDNKSSDFRSGFWETGWILLLVCIPITIIASVFLLAGIPLLTFGFNQYSNDHLINNYNINFITSGSICLGLASILYIPITIYGFTYISVITGDFIEKNIQKKTNLNPLINLQFQYLFIKNII